MKALVMHSVSGDVRMFPWLGEREHGSDNVEITQVLRVGTGHCQEFIIKHEEGGHGHQGKSAIACSFNPGQS